MTNLSGVNELLEDAVGCLAEQTIQAETGIKWGKPKDPLGALKIALSKFNVFRLPRSAPIADSERKGFRGYLQQVLDLIGDDDDLKATPKLSKMFVDLKGKTTIRGSDLIGMVDEFQRKNRIGGLRESADPFASARKSIGKGTPEEKEELKKLDKELRSLESRTAAWNSSGDLTKQEMDKIRSKRKVRAALKKRDGLYKSLSGNWSVGSTIKKRKAEIEAYKIYLDELLSASRHKGKYGYI
jgi:hypothetical protein